MITYRLVHAVEWSRQNKIRSSPQITINTSAIFNEILINLVRAHNFIDPKSFKNVATTPSYMNFIGKMEKQIDTKCSSIDRRTGGCDETFAQLTDMFGDTVPADVISQIGGENKWHCE